MTDRVSSFALPAPLPTPHQVSVFIHALKKTTIRFALSDFKSCSVGDSWSRTRLWFISMTSLSQLRPQSRLRRSGLRGPAVMLESRV